MKILSASFFLAIGLGIGTMISAVTTNAASNAPREAQLASANEYVQVDYVPVVETEMRDAREDSPQ